MLNLDIDRGLPDKYDTILCIDVIEHVTNPEELLRNLVDHLETGGKLIVTQIECAGKSELNALHFKIGFNARQLLVSLNLIRIDNYSSDLTIWEKK